MKKILMLAVLLAVAAASFSRMSEGVSPSVVAAFETNFSNAKDISWDIRKDFTKASFTIDGQQMFAYFRNNGELMAITRNIKPSQLPLSLAQGLNNSYDDAWLTELFELSADGVTTYYATFKNSRKNIILRGSAGGGWVVHKKRGSR